MNPEDKRKELIASYRKNYYQAIGSAIYARVYIEENYPEPGSDNADALSDATLGKAEKELMSLADILLNCFPSLRDALRYVK